MRDDAMPGWNGCRNALTARVGQIGTLAPDTAHGYRTFSAADQKPDVWKPRPANQSRWRWRWQ